MENHWRVCGFFGALRLGDCRGQVVVFTRALDGAETGACVGAGTNDGTNAHLLVAVVS